MYDYKKPHGNPWVSLNPPLSLGVCLSNPNEAPPVQNSYIFGGKEN